MILIVFGAGEGRIEKTGELLCSYHAWRFDGSGQCTAIPQAESAEQQARQMAKAEHCARAHPVVERQGLVWVWGRAGAPGSDVAMQAALKQPQLIEELEDPSTRNKVSLSPWSARHLPYGWDVLMEVG